METQSVAPFCFNIIRITMSGLSSVTLTTVKKDIDTFSFDESISCMLFDYGLRPDAFDNYPLLKQSFGDNQVVLINNLKEAGDFGLVDNDFMNGVPYYHISKFYNYIGTDAPIYIVFSKCVTNYMPDYKILEDIQRQTNGKIFQVGIWTEYNLWKKNTDGSYGFTSLLANIQYNTNELNNFDSFPMSVVLNAGTSILENDNSQEKVVDYNMLPDASSLDFRYISVVLGQNGTDNIHNRQLKNVNYAPFGLLGYCMACLYLAPAEMSIAFVKDFDLNKNDDLLSPELGFGKISLSGNSQFTLMETINKVRKNIICQKGYIIPIGYQAKEGQVYLCNDQTLTLGDYRSIANNRVMGKCRRAIKYALLRHVNSDVAVDPSTGLIDSVDASSIVSDILKSIDSVMANKQGQQQIQGRSVSIDEENSDVINDRTLSISASIIPAGSSEIINMKDSYEI